MENKETNSIKIMTYNIRCRTFIDRGNRSWKRRSTLVGTVIKNNNPDIIGLQEVRKDQYKFLKEFLTEYDNINVYRDISPDSESNPVFYRRDMFTLISSDTFWLSTTPEKTSKGWGADCYRICTALHLKDNRDNTEFYFMNTHLDHISEDARKYGIQVIFDRIKDCTLPVILIGDFNAERGEKAIEIADSHLLDCGTGFADYSAGTFNNYILSDRDKYSKIDYIYRTKDRVNVTEYNVDYTIIDNKFPSDHFPIICKVDIVR